MMLYSAGAVRDVAVRGDNLCGLTWWGELLWYADADLQQVVAVDPYTADVLHSIACPGLCAGLATLNGNLVYATEPDYALVVIVPPSGTRFAQARNPRPGRRMLAMEGGRDGLWLGYRNMLDLRSPTEFAPMAVIDVPGNVTGIAPTDNFVVYADGAAESIMVVDPRLEEVVLPINVDGNPTGLAWDGCYLWYCDNATNRIRAIDVPGMVGPL